MVPASPSPAYRVRLRFYRFTQIRSYQRGPTRWLWRALRLLGHVWSMTRVATAAHRFDVVHVHFPAVPRLDVWWLRWIARRTRLVYSVHNLYPHDVARDRSLHRLYRTIYGTSHALIAHTDATVRGLVREFAVPEQKITQIPLGNMNQVREPAQVGAAAPLRPLPTDAPVILMFGAIRPGKGLDVLLRAAAILRRDNTPFRLVVAGDPDRFAATYRALAEELELGDSGELRFGYVPEEHVAAYFAAAAVVALPYRAIDQSGVAVAAVSAGRPVVATRLAGLAEIVERGDCGLLIPVDDPVALAAALQRLLRDEELRQRLGANARRYADVALDWRPIAVRTAEVYRRA
jgi:glycosyltransferase involved in cell wall biosynthesis